MYLKFTTFYLINLSYNTKLNLLMKKILFIVLLVTFQSCETGKEVKATRDFSDVSEYYDAFYKDAFQNALDLKISKKEDINLISFTTQAIVNLDGKHFVSNKEFASNFESSLKEQRNNGNINRKGRSSSIIVNDYPGHYTSAMVLYCEDYLYPNLDGATTTMIGRSVATYFEGIIIAASDLTSAEKNELYSLVAGIRSTADMIDSGVVDEMGDLLEDGGYIQVGDPNARMGCAVSTRGVLADGVVGFFAGGAAGAYSGCAGGTFVLPGLGTVTGCVGGAVVGGLGGFVGGALQSVASQLLQTCWR